MTSSMAEGDGVGDLKDVVPGTTLAETLQAQKDSPPPSSPAPCPGAVLEAKSNCSTAQPPNNRFASPSPRPFEQEPSYQRSSHSSGTTTSALFSKPLWRAVEEGVATPLVATDGAVAPTQIDARPMMGMAATLAYSSSGPTSTTFEDTLRSSLPCPLPGEGQEGGGAAGESDAASPPTVSAFESKAHVGGRTTASGDGSGALVNQDSSDDTSTEDESADEDEESLFQETVLLLDNELHSLGSTLRKPPQSHQSRSGERSSGSPFPQPLPSLESTPVGKSEMHAATSVEDRRDLHQYGDATCSTADGILSHTTDRPTCFSKSAPASRATTRCGPATSAPMMPSPTPQRHALYVDPRPASPVAATAASPEAAAEYVFIDNRDGTAYLADASLQLDGSYVLGQTILLAQKTTASPLCYRRCDVTGPVSPEVKPQAQGEMPPRRAEASHRPIRETRLSEIFNNAAVSASPLPKAVEGQELASSASPRVSLVVRPRSMAPSRDQDNYPVHGCNNGHRPLSLTFEQTFCFEETLFIPLEDAATACDSSTDAAALSFSTHPSSVSAASVRWDRCVSPAVVVPTMRLPSFADTSTRERGVPRPSPSPRARAAADARASPVPQPPCLADQIAPQQARATREARADRSERDVFYLLPRDTPMSTLTPEDITRSGWMPVQVVSAVPPWPSSVTTNVGCSRTPVPDGTDTSKGAYDQSRLAEGGGGAESPLPVRPSPTPAFTAARGEPHDATKAAKVVPAAPATRLEREPSLSRRSCSHPSDAAAADGMDEVVPSPVPIQTSTLSASTLESINRRLHYSTSSGASVCQRFGVDEVNGFCSLDRVARPAAASDPLTDCGCRRFPWADTAAASLYGGVQREASILFWGGTGGRGGDAVDAHLLERPYDTASPPPLRPDSVEAPQRELSPSRCRTAASCLSPSSSEVPEGATAMAECGSEAQRQAAPALHWGDVAGEERFSSLLTSMSYQRPSTLATMTESYRNDSSLSIPLTSSASASLAAGTRRSSTGFYSTAGGGSVAVSLRYHGQAIAQQRPWQPPQQRIRRSRRLSNTLFSTGTGSSSVLTYAASEQSARMPSSMGLLGRRVPPVRSSRGEDRVDSNSMSTAGLPLTRGVLPHQRLMIAPQRAGMVSSSRFSEGGRRSGGTVFTSATAEEMDARRRRKGVAPRVETVSRDKTFHPHTGTVHVPSQQPRNGRAATRSNAGLFNEGPASAHLVPDTSVFLPWAPLTITPEGSLNLGRGGGGEGALDSTLTWMPSTSSAAASGSTAPMSITTSAVTTTVTAMGRARSRPSTAAHGAHDGAAPRETARSLKTVRVSNTTMAAAMLRTAAANRQPPASSAMMVLGRNAVNRDAALPTLPQSSVLQVPTRVEGSLSSEAATSISVATTATASAVVRSMALSRTSAATSLHGNDIRDSSKAMAAAARLEATAPPLSISSWSCSSMGGLEPEPMDPVVGTALETDGGAPFEEVQAKENETASPSGLGCASRRLSEIADRTRPHGLREGSTVNAVVGVRLSGKAPSPAVSSTP